jgi:hypothetical protein
MLGIILALKFQLAIQPESMKPAAGFRGAISMIASLITWPVAIELGMRLM